eukprot:1366369-Amorphochlora_amoeboformis.AAC.2
MSISRCRYLDVDISMSRCQYVEVDISISISRCRYRSSCRYLDLDISFGYLDPDVTIEVVVELYKEVVVSPLPSWEEVKEELPDNFDWRVMNNTIAVTAIRLLTSLEFIIHATFLTYKHAQYRH